MSRTRCNQYNTYVYCTGSPLLIIRWDTPVNGYCPWVQRAALTYFICKKLLIRYPKSSITSIGAPGIKATTELGIWYI